MSILPCTERSVAAILDVTASTRLAIVSLYPNPTSGKIYFSAETESMEVEVYNIFGHILDTKLIRGKDNIDLTTFENGAYFLKIRVNGKRIIRKVIKYN